MLPGRSCHHYQLLYSEFSLAPQKLRSRQYWRAILAELLGTLLLVSAVLGSSVPGPGPGDAPGGPLYPAVAVGAVIVSLCHCFGEISGAQVNPSVTLSMMAARRIDVLKALLYVAAQCVGAFLATGIFYLALPHKAMADYLVNKVPIELNAAQAVGMEVLCTFQMVFTVLSVQDQQRRKSPEPANLAIGFAHVSAILIAARFSGACMNPARALGPAIITNFWENHWVFWIGPVSGGVLAALTYEFLFAHSASRQKLVACMTCKDIEIVEPASVSRSSLSTIGQHANRAKQANKQEGN
ncbi:aquaporin [Genypterus blacodes]|uniref:aquaporin n=1 Tax=Genypterus blacodes TaxID=154954 RepID=UPI003F7715A1